MKKKLLFLPEGERFLYECAPALNRLARDPAFELHCLMAEEPYSLNAEPNPNKVSDLSDRIVIHAYPRRPKAGLKTIRAVENAMGRFIRPRLLGEWLLNSIPMVLLLALFDMCDLWITRRQAERVFKTIDPQALLITRDRNLGLQTALNRLMRKAGRSVIILPWGYPNTAFLVATRMESPRNHLQGPQVSSLQRRLKKENSPHIYSHEGRDYSYYKPGRYLAASNLDICPSRPWVHGADSDLCMVDSAATADFLENHGVPTDVIRVTGNQIHDSLYRSEAERKETRQRLMDAYDTGNRQILIFAVPHLPEHNLVSWEVHREEMRFAVRRMQQITEAQVLLSIHPRSDPENYRFLTEELGTPMLSEPLKVALGGADYFICHWSGTTVWGPMIGIPTLVLDYFAVPDLGFSHLDNEVIQVSQKDQLDDCLRRLMTHRCPENSPNLPILDGKSTSRVVDAIKDCLEMRNSQCTSA